MKRKKSPKLNIILPNNSRNSPNESEIAEDNEEMPEFILIIAEPIGKPAELNAKLAEPHRYYPARTHYSTNQSKKNFDPKP